jgi:hypothetical protein
MDDEMQEITLEEFDKNKIGRGEKLSFVAECAWFRWGHALGVISADSSDNTFSAVALIKDQNGVYRAELEGMAPDHKTVESAKAVLKEMLRSRRGIEFAEMSSPLNREEAALFIQGVIPPELLPLFLVPKILEKKGKSALDGLRLIFSTVGVPDRGFAFVVHPVGSHPSKTLEADPEITPFGGPFETEEQAVAAGRTYMSALVQRLLENGFDADLYKKGSVQ